MENEFKQIQKSLESLIKSVNKSGMCGGGM